MVLGVERTQEWRDTDALIESPRRFYRVGYRDVESPGDADNDGLDDMWELRRGSEPFLNDALWDYDQDGLALAEEYTYGTNPFEADTDVDGLPDAWEVLFRQDPLSAANAEADPDGDGRVNRQEYLLKTHPWRYASSVQVVGIAGSFNDWNAAESLMALTNNRQWVGYVRLSPGIVAFKFVGDGSWSKQWAVPAGTAVFPLPVLQQPVVRMGTNIRVQVETAGLYRFELDEGANRFSVAGAEEEPAEGGEPCPVYNLAGSWNGWNNSSLETSLFPGPGGLYQRLVWVTAATNHEFKWVRNSSWLWTWGETNQAEMEPDWVGEAERDVSAGNIQLRVAPAGVFRFWFVPSNGQYGVERVADDTDGDELMDGEERDRYGTDPSRADTDGDGLGDGMEVRRWGTDPSSADSDGDGLSDGWEVRTGLNALSGEGEDGAAGDPDGDGLSNAGEYEAQTQPRNSDTDGDGVSDGQDETPTVATCYWAVQVVKPLPGVDKGCADGSGGPRLEETLVFDPDLGTSGVRIAKMVWRGYVDDAFKVDGREYCWDMEPDEFEELDVTGALSNRESGVCTIEVYDYVHVGWPSNRVVFGGEAEIEYLVPIEVEVAGGEIWLCDGGVTTVVVQVRPEEAKGRVGYTVGDASVAEVAKVGDGVVRVTAVGPGRTILEVRDGPAICSAIPITVVKVDIIQPSSLWWFPTVVPSGYQVSDVAEAGVEPSGLDGHGTFKWKVLGSKGYGALGLILPGGGSAQTVTKTDDKYVNVFTKGYSDVLGDVTLKLTYTPPGASSPLCTVQQDITVRTFMLVLGSTWNEPNGSGWSTFRYMYVKDQFGADVPSAVDVNECFTDWQSLWPGETWPSPMPGSSSGYTWWQDWVSMPGPSMYIPQPVNPTDASASTPVDRAIQTWRYGSIVSGDGDVFIGGVVNLQRNLGYAVHTH